MLDVGRAGGWRGEGESHCKPGDSLLDLNSGHQLLMTVAERHIGPQKEDTNSHVPEGIFSHLKLSWS
jgi:hypothetical protein